jgi:hypothetical protein
MAADSPGKLAQIRQMVAMTARTDPKYVPVLAASAVLGGAVAFVVGLLLAGPILAALLAVLTMLVEFTTITGRRSQKAALTQIEGQPGAAYAVLQSMRGDWRITPAVAFNKNQDIVHRVVGRSGVILVLEGAGARGRELLSAELRKVRRVIGEAPMHDVVIGDGDGQVPLRKLSSHLMRMKPAITKTEVSEVAKRLRALGGVRPPIPKGIDPTRARPDRRATRGR